MNKELRRIEAKLDALLKDRKIDPDSIEVTKPAAAQSPRPLSEAEQQAIANAPKPTPPPVAAPGPRVTATNAPSVASSVPPKKPDETGAKDLAEQLAAKKADSGAKGPSAKE